MRGILSVSSAVGLLFGLGLALLVGELTLAAPPAQERISLQYGQTVTGFIDDTHFFQQYSFVGSAGDAVVITMDALSGNLDPLLLLGDSALNLIAEDDDGGGGFNARLEVVLPANGTYVIEATRYGQDTEAGLSSGEYRLTLLAQQAVGSESTRRGGVFLPLNFGETRRGILDAENRFHLYWFQAQEGDQVLVQSALSVDVAAALFLYDATFAEVSRDTDGRRVEAELDAGGVYFVAVALADPQAGGTYALTLSGSRGAAPGNLRSVPLAYGQRIEGVIVEERPAEQYTFQGSANDQVLIRMEALDRELDPFLYLYGPEGEIVGQDDDSGGGRNAELATVLPVDGEYTILATRFGRENGSGAGGYVLSLNQGVASFAPDAQFVPQVEDSLPADFAGLPQLHYRDTVGGTITDEEYYRAFVFQARAGDEIVATMERTNGDLDPLVMLMDADLETIAQHDDISVENRNARLEFTIPEDGFYALLATRYEGETGATSGDFVLTLDAANVPLRSQAATLLPATLMTSGETASGQIGEAIASPFAFYATAGDVVELTLTATGPLAQESILVLADADLNEIAVSFDGALRYAALETGLHVVLVSRQGGPLGDARGFFELSLSGATATAVESAVEAGTAGDTGDHVLSYGAVVTGEITDAQPEVVYTFAGRTGDRVTVRMEALDATLDPLLILADAEGNLILRDDDSAGNLNALIDSHLLTQEGEYTIIATRFGGENGSSRGRFELILAGVPVSQSPASQGQAGESPGVALSISPGQTVSGTISNEVPAVFYVFQAEAGTAFEISMVTAEGDLDPFVALLDGEQALVAADDDSGGNRNARLAYTVPADGLYYIVATRFELLEGTTTGQYLLSLVAR